MTRRRKAPLVDSGRFCKDCKEEGVKNRRPTPYPGPRCKTHHLARRKALSARNHGAHLEKTFGITSEQYDALYQAQGGVCYICRRATGKTKRLAVDHDHKTGFVRGLLCTSCNRGILGHLRDSVLALLRAVKYLLHPPAFRVIGKVKAPIESSVYIGADVTESEGNDAG